MFTRFLTVKIQMRKSSMKHVVSVIVILFLLLNRASAQNSTSITQDSIKSDADTSAGAIQSILLETRRTIRRDVQLPNKFINDNYVIVLDPGHGGTKYIDKGFSAKLDDIEYFEKDIAWEYAQLIQQKLTSSGYEGVQLTKPAANDSSLSIHTRAARARQFGIDVKKKVLFVSLHWNNFEDPSVHGTEIYIKEQHNYRSRKLAEFIRGTLGQIMQMHGYGENILGIIERDYKVLRELDTGVLIELGYASNQADLRKMLTQKEEIAGAIVQGIDAFAYYLQGLDQKNNKTDDPAKAAEEWKLAQLPSIPFGWSWRKQDVNKDIQNLLNQYRAIYEDVRPGKNIYLTFDCGYENGYTPVILDVLKANNVKAAFFITGGYLKQSPEVVQRILEDGHIVGNHSVNHLSMPQLNVRDAKNEILGLERDFFDLFEKKMVYFRPPSGEFSRRALAVTASLGYRTVFWSLAYDDWDTNIQRGKEYAYNKIVKGARDGVIVLLHAVSKDNAEAMDSIIKELRKQGYEFKTLDDIP
jgi:peptidoglycan-N-acetylmuramic acid deacetylase